MTYKECPYCGKKALRAYMKVYHFDTKSWLTVPYTVYKCRWCKRFVEYPDE